MFNNNSAQILQNSQARTYNTRQASQGTQNIFSSQATSPNPFSNQQQQSGSSNIFANQNTSSTIFTQPTSQRNPFSNPNSSSSSPAMNLPLNQSTIFRADNPLVQASFQAYHHQQGLLKTFHQIVRLQEGSQLQNLLKLLSLSLQRAEDVMNRAMKQGEAEVKESSQTALRLRKEIKEKCKVIKGRNSQILQQLLDLRAKLTHVFYQTKRRSQQHELEMERIIDRVRQITISVKRKRTEFYLQRQFQANATKPGQQRKILTRPLLELGQAAERLEREAMQTREEFGLVMGWLRDEGA